MSRDCPVLHTSHSHTHTHKLIKKGTFLIRGESQGFASKQQNRPLNMYCEYTHTHTTNHVSRDEEALTRFYMGVDALPSISDPLPLLLLLHLSLSPVFSGGDTWEDVCLITAFS